MTITTDTITGLPPSLLDRARSDWGADWAFRAMLVISVPVFYVVGRQQWFIRDDWAFLLSRNTLRQTQGNAAWLLTAQDGHWMTPPLLMYRALDNLFGLESYWPYLILNLAMHIGIVLLVRIACRRWGVSAWTTTLLCSILLLFGSGWENIVFAIQITYNLSLLCFLAQVLLVDHDGPADRRDWIGAGLGVIGVMSSGFGPFFIAGMIVLLALRQRWTALLIAVVPQGLAYGWWYLAWETDYAADAIPGPRSQVPAFAVRGISATFESLTALAPLAGIAILGALAVTMLPDNTGRVRSALVAMWATTVLMFLGVGLHRIGFGVLSAGASRYQYMAAAMLIPCLGLAIERLAVWSVAGRRAAQIVLACAIVLNVGWLQTSGAEWAARAAESKDLFELIAGSELAAQVPPTTRVDSFNPDVNVGWLSYLVAKNAITPRSPTTPAEIARVRAALGLDPAG